MPAVLGVDACSLLHCKQLQGPLDIVTTLIQQGPVTLLTSKGVHEDMVDCSLSTHLAEWERQQQFFSAKVRPQQVNEVRNKLKPGMKAPGKRDMALIALARDERVPFFTHDGPAAALAKVIKVTTVDFLDLAAFVVSKGWLTWPDVEARYAALQGFAWRPDDLAPTGVEATMASRPHWPRTLAALQAWC